ncbi:hypothetical protein T4B_9496 [Trichinella pseudospiralis]|uniref:Uncharacterized protein n=2 Tax=Trichinella pseudospiralis TaxID=6337 RepID=A0A0V1IMM9_TRIPS|nr:hypothetical protein T4A_3094 [Trichinella pseudospiralis]KRY84093.1 hypothetical protein T4D_6618 [Trichinella pseudospiralis]KRZ24048.1 hypothetical protein T4B_9496 [Trichinella pseudospiralis]KRZ39062.1 hypothetical protein T4C_10822 [Trichinella pseudospiralis]
MRENRFITAPVKKCHFIITHHKSANWDMRNETIDSTVCCDGIANSLYKKEMYKQKAMKDRC